jgi:LysM repeat protein
MPTPSVTNSPTRTTTPSSTEAPSAVRVGAGDTMTKIAARLGVSVDALVQANVGQHPSLATNRNAIQQGWMLAAPGSAAAQTTPPPPPANTGWGSAGGRPGTVSTPTVTTGPVPGRNPVGDKMAAAGAQSIEMRMKQHNDAIDKTGVGTYYGDHAAWKTMSATEKQDWLKANTKPGVTPPSAGSIKESSCIGWAMDNVGAAYAAAGKSARWSEIMHNVVAKGSKGMDLAKELKKDGWQSIYWNPDAKHPDDANPEHSFSATQVARGNGYYGMPIDATVENYRPTDGQGTTKDMSGIDKLSKVPFFFGLAKGGVHTFVGRQGDVNEFHWSEMPDSHHAIQQTPLKDWGWNSGVIMVPPGTWPKS